jgi:hypothetical protein
MCKSLKLKSKAKPKFLLKKVSTLKCNKCKETKPVSDFYRNKNHKTGYCGICRQCIWLRNIKNAKWIKCSCGCGQTRLDRDYRGRKRKYVYGHQNRGKKIDSIRGKNNWNWKGGRRKHEGYWQVYRPEHPQAGSSGYVYEHRIVYEEYHKCCLLKGSRIHHKDGDGLNNEISNLILTSAQEHPKYHREDLGQKSERCNSVWIIRRGLKNGRQRFICNDCRLTWTINNERSVDFGQVCYNCGSKYIERRGIRNNKQRFSCKGCRGSWSIPLQDLKQIIPQNNSRYVAAIKRKQKK